MSLKSLPVALPLEYAELIGVSRSQISHVNAGRHFLTSEQIVIVMDAMIRDGIVGLTIFDLKPNIKILEPYWPPKKTRRTRRGK